MQCNIDARGRAVRLWSGVLCCAIGGVFAAVALLSRPSALLWGIAAGSLLGGLFQIFEGRKGWCAIRALGIRTPV